MSIYSRRRKPIKDFYRKNYGNPMFGRFHHRKSWLTVGVAKVILLAVAAIAVVGFVIWLLFWSRTFRIKNIEINGASAATEQTVRDIMNRQFAGRVIGFIPRSSIFSFSTDLASADVARAFYLDDLTMRKKLPDTLIVGIKEKVVVAVLSDQNLFLGIDKSGYVVRNLTEKEIRDIADLPPDITSVAAPSLGAEAVDVPPELAADAGQADAGRRNRNPLPLLIDEGRGHSDSELARHPGVQSFSQSTMTLVMAAYGLLPDIAGPVKWLKVDEPAESVTAVMVGDWNVNMTTALPFDVQGQRLSLILKEKVGAQKPLLEYVDLRYKDKIYFRLKEKPVEPDKVVPTTKK